MPFTFDAKYIVFRLLSPVPSIAFQAFLCSPASPADSVRDRTRVLGWRERADRRAYSALEGLTPLTSEQVRLTNTSARLKICRVTADACTR